MDQQTYIAMVMFIGAVTLWYFCVFVPENNTRLSLEKAVKTEIDLLFLTVRPGLHSWILGDPLLTFHECVYNDDANELRRRAMVWARRVANKGQGEIHWVSLPFYYTGQHAGKSGLYLRLSFFVVRSADAYSEFDQNG